MDFGKDERACQTSFDSEKNYWHGYTSGRDTPTVFSSDCDYNFCMNVIAQAAFVYMKQLKIIAFQIMSNHFHFILSGRENDIEDFFSFICKRLARSLPLIRKLHLQLKPISDLQAMRNNIVYTNRNGYVVHPDHTPFSYPWGTSSHYFNRSPAAGEVKDKTVSQLRLMFRGRNPQLPGDWNLISQCPSAANKTCDCSCISPTSYCSIDLGMAMFRDAHHYFSMVSKNVEAYSNLAADLDDGEFLTDSELFSQLRKILQERYQESRIKDLSNAQKIDIAKILHYDYRSSNGQIRRLLGLSQYEIDSIFPLSAKK